MTVETSNLIGGLMCGLSLGAGVTVCVVMWWRGRCWERASDAALVDQARCCMDDLEGDGQAEILALFRARAALQNLAHTLARKDNGGFASAGSNVTAEKGSIDDSINY